MESATVEEKCIGLDAVSRSTMKLFVHDILHLKPVECPTLKDKALLSYKGHVVNRVEAMGIIVRMDKREQRQSYAIDDGTGVIQCTIWNNSRNDGTSSISAVGLPSSLKQKLGQLQTALAESQEGYSLGDLLLVRGSVKSFRGQLEVDVLDHRKIENPCLEYERVIHLPSLYKLYNAPLKLPAAIDRALKSSARSAFNQEAVQSAIAREIQSSFTSLVIDPVFTTKDVLLWPSVAELVRQDEVERQATNPARDNSTDHTAIVSSALRSLESTRGWVFSWEGHHHDSPPTFEMITAHCPLSRHVLSVLRGACSRSERNAEQGCHIQHLLDQLKWRGLRDDAGAKYNHMTQLVLSRALDCLEDNSDLIAVGCQRFLPVD